MKTAYLIDASGPNRDAVSSQLKMIGFQEVTLFKTLEETHKTLLGAGSPPDIILVSDVVTPAQLHDFQAMVRLNKSNVAIVSVASSVSLDQMTTLIQSGVDQILLFPSTPAALKKKIEDAIAFRLKVVNENKELPSDREFKCYLDSFTPEIHKLTLNGYLSEDAALPEMKDLPSGSTIFVNFDRLRGLNSVGIRLWVLWLKAMKNKGVAEFIFEKIRPAILSQAATLSEFFPEKYRITSLYLTYFNDETDEEQDFLIDIAKHLKGGKVGIPKFQVFTLDGKSLTYELEMPFAKLSTIFKGNVELT